jgi:signal transduction histidine kinase
MSDDNKRRANERLVAIGKLGAGIIHEVKNVMTSIRGFAQVGQLEDSESERLLAILRTIERESGHAVETLNDFLSFARSPERRMETVDINECVSGSWQLVSHQLAMRQISGELRLERELPSIEADPRELKQVFVNLFLNARDAIGEGGKIQIDTWLEGASSIAIRVSDSGSGIPPEIRAEVFAPFFTTKPEGEGNGLGLAISLQIVQEHGGSLEVGDGELGGAALTILLPVAAPEE